MSISPAAGQTSVLDTRSSGHSQNVSCRPGPLAGAEAIRASNRPYFWLNRW
jgi:hypothetical protein